MPKIVDHETRWRLSETFRRVKKIDGFAHARLKDLDNILGHARLARTEAHRECRVHLMPLLNAAYAHLAVLSGMALGMLIQEERPLPSDWLGSSPSENKRSNFILQSNLTQLVNHTLSVLSLIERGFANSARSLLRTLIETTWVTIIFCGDRDKAQQYVLGTDFDIAKRIWQKHFTSRSMITTLQDIEKHLGLDADLAEYLNEHRQGIYQLHTQSTHNTCAVMGILSFDQDLTKEGEDASMYPSLHGLVGVAAKSTLEDTVDVLGYAVFMLFLLFHTMHNYKSSDQDSFWALSQAFALGSLGLWFGAIGFQPMAKVWSKSPCEPTDDE